MSSTKRVVVITGGNGGIGAAIGKKFSENGDIVVLGDIKEDVVKFARDLAQKEDKEIFGSVIDVTDPSSVSGFFSKLSELTGKGSVDILVNNAGITRDAMFRKMTFEQWDTVLKVNLYGTYNCTKEAVEGMIQQNSGRIINITSISRYGNKGQANYAASKAGIVGLTLTLARELAKHNITVNAISPGIIDTELVKTIPESIMSSFLSRNPTGRLGKPEEIAALVLFLSSSEASYINGEVINVNGGFFF